MSSLSPAVLGPYLSLWLKNIGLGFSEIGLVQSVSELAQLLADFPTKVIPRASAGKFGLGEAYLFAGFLGLPSALSIWGLTFLSVPDEGGNIPEKPSGR
ncbi:hypothetical protein [Thermococcus sp.]|uniref:hypothetical protein n=1 Tax=Thermococcus sp. TaxID=35749 RepID=UPI00260586C1|nr:hypothetical protein [Thermococcus sp.]